MPVLNWIGREKVLDFDAKVPLKSLVEKKDLSVNPHMMPENIIAKGDNLEVLKALTPFYRGKVKCIYIDPPYNTGNENWAYNDNVNSPEMKAWLGKVVGKEDLCRHDKWLCMMYPRLKLMKELLRNDGFIFISIDNNEIHHLRSLMDEIWGRSNFVNCLIVKRASKNINNQFKNLKSLNQGFEFILVYKKSKEAYWVHPYAKSDGKRKRGYWTSFWSTADRPTMRYELLGFQPQTGQWKWSREKALAAVKNYQEYEEKYKEKYPELKDFWEATGKVKKFIRRKGQNIPQYWVEPSEKRLLDTDWTDLYVNDNKIKKYFDTPKSLKLIKRIIKASTQNDDIILDCFAGSGTTGQAVLEINEEIKESRRKFLLIEINNYAENIIQERLKTKIETGGEKLAKEGFKFMELGEVISKE